MIRDLNKSMSNLYDLPDSPCIGVCSALFDEVCRGCGRTAFEVSNWVFFSAEESARYGRVLRGKGRRCGLGAAVWRAALKTWTLKNALHGVVIMGDALHFLSGAEKNRDSLV